MSPGSAPTSSTTMPLTLVRLLQVVTRVWDDVSPTQTLIGVAALALLDTPFVVDVGCRAHRQEYFPPADDRGHRRRRRRGAGARQRAADHVVPVRAALGLAVVSAVIVAATGSTQAVLEGYRAGLAAPLAAAVLGTALTAGGLIHTRMRSAEPRQRQPPGLEPANGSLVGLGGPRS
jgi:hypothetical protein